MPRYALSFSGNGTSPVYDTGKVPLVGTIDQLRWVPDTKDTGPGPSSATITVWFGSTDTGAAAIAYNGAGVVLGGDFTDHIHDTGGHPFVTSGDKLKARLLPTDTGAYSGKLHIHTTTPEAI